MTKWVFFRGTSGFVIPSSFVIRASSFIAKCVHRIEAHGGASRQITGGQSDEKENYRHEGEARRIVRGNAVQTPRQKLGEEKCAHESDYETGQNKSQPLTCDEPQNVAGLRTQRHPHADFLRALPH